MKEELGEVRRKGKSRNPVGSSGHQTPKEGQCCMNNICDDACNNTDNGEIHPMDDATVVFARSNKLKGTCAPGAQGFPECKGPKRHEVDGQKIKVNECNARKTESGARLPKGHLGKSAATRTKGERLSKGILVKPAAHACDESDIEVDEI